jgi:hypothetical protein
MANMLSTTNPPHMKEAPDLVISPQMKLATPDTEWQGFADEYWQRLVNTRRREYDVPLFAGFRTLQQQNLLHLQNRLVKIKCDIASKGTTSEEQMEALLQVMHDYSKL